MKEARQDTGPEPIRHPLDPQDTLEPGQGLVTILYPNTGQELS